MSTHTELSENKPANLEHTRNEERILKSHFDDNTLFRHRQLVLLASKLHCKRGNLINYDLYLENVLSPQVSRSLYWFPLPSKWQPGLFFFHEDLLRILPYLRLSFPGCNASYPYWRSNLEQMLWSLIMTNRKRLVFKKVFSSMFTFLLGTYVG